MSLQTWDVPNFPYFLKKPLLVQVIMVWGKLDKLLQSPDFCSNHILQLLGPLLWPSQNLDQVFKKQQKQESEQWTSILKCKMVPY